MTVDNLGSGKISRLVGRLRSNSSPVDSGLPSKPSTAIESDRPPIAGGGGGGGGVSKSGDGFRSHFKPTRIIKTPSFMTTASSASSSDRKRTPTPSSSSRSSSSSTVAPDAALSLQLWNEAYDYLRDAPPTAGLAIAFEGIICQELPDHLKLGMSMTFRDHPEHRRSELMQTIAASGMAKRRGSKGSGVEDETRRLLDVCKDEIAAIVETYPSAAVAYCGLCTLTPLLLDPPVQRHDTLRQGITYLAGRIKWYMLLTNMLNHTIWESGDSYKSQAAGLRDTIVRLYRKVLEFQMNMVCATASAWNRAAKNVVDWQGLGQMVEGLVQLDREVRAVVDKEPVEAWRKRLASLDRDLEPEQGPE